MSRLGKKPIVIPAKTDIKVDGDMLIVKGPLGELKRRLVPSVVIKVEGENATVSAANESTEASMMQGTYVAHLKNMIAGVNSGFQKKLIVEGIGYKADVKGTDIVMSLGFSHPVVVKVPTGIKAVIEKGIMAISGIDKDQVGQFAALVRDQKKPEPYKGKGIRYENEVIRRKQGKKTV